MTLGRALLFAAALACRAQLLDEGVLLQMAVAPEQRAIGASGHDESKKGGRGGCKRWCEEKVESGGKTWEEVCEWNNCRGCDECLHYPPGHYDEECRGWCEGAVESRGKTWEEVCEWKNCRGCEECEHTTTKPPTTSATDAAPRWPSQVMTCGTAPVEKTESMTCADYDAVVQSVRGLYNSLDSSCGGESCEQADWAGCVLRLAGHDLMDFKDGRGGADGCLDFFDADNKGLAECLHSGTTSVLDAYKVHCGKISLADFLVLAAEAVMTLSREHVTEEDPARGGMDFRSGFRFGRRTAPQCDFVGPLPNPERSCTAVNETFVKNMALGWPGAAALMGVHTLGRAQVGNSGYDGFWSDAENARRFNNNYYAGLLAKGWMPQKAVAGNAEKNQWQRSDLGRGDQARRGKEMMLDTDLCLAYTRDRAGTQELRAGGSSCCTWISPSRIPEAIDALDGEYCGGTTIPTGSRAQRAVCCKGNPSETDCGSFVTPRGPAFASVRDFASDEGAWLRAFLQAWRKSTENGHGDLRPLEACGA